MSLRELIEALMAAERCKVRWMVLGFTVILLLVEILTTDNWEEY